MSIGPEAGRRHGRVTGWVGALRRRPWVAERSDDAAYRDDEAVAAARAESGQARQSLQDCSIDLTMTKIASMTPTVPRGKIIGERVGAQPVDELDHFHQCEAGVDF